MAGTSRHMYVGTEAGIVTLAETDSGWDLERTALDGKDVDALTASNEAVA